MLYEKLPYDIAERHVLLMDPILASGNTVAAAIEALGLQSKSFLLSQSPAGEKIHRCSQSIGM